MDCLLGVGIIVFLMVLGYWKLVRPHSYWSRRGVSQGRPVFLLGDGWRMLLRKDSGPEAIVRFHNIDQEARYVGIYQFLAPNLVIRDPDLIKQITVKDFDHFVDHRRFDIPKDDSLFDKNLFFFSGQEWKEMRNVLTPCFTANKMKFVFSLISQSGERFVRYFLEKEENLVTVEMKDVVSKFSIDAIGNTVFGIECDCFKDPNNEFYLMAKEATDFFSFKKFLVIMGYLVAPKLCRFFNLRFLSEKMCNYFTRIVKENIESREQQGIIRPDMINVLMEAKKHNEQETEKNQTVITDEDITAQAFTFFFGGFETVANLICFMAHELAVNPEIQEKLKREIDESQDKCNGKITYEAITTMKYMDMVVSETLRKYPSNVSTDRICTKPYTIEPKNPNEKPLHLNVNDSVLIPIFAIQRDPKYFPDPERFDPDRFNEENKSKIPPGAYIPFGFGPRMCIALRFALLETKILFYHLLLHYEIIPVEKTQIPIKFSKKVFNIQPEEGFWLGLKRRQS